MALIHNAPRAATVTAKTALTTLELDKAAFDRVLHNSSSIAMAMVSEISNRLRLNDQMAVDDLRMRASELAEAYQKLAEQDLARREFLTNVAHELRTPLMIASGYLQMLQKGMMSGDQLTAGIDSGRAQRPADRHARQRHPLPAGDGPRPPRFPGSGYERSRRE
jgi:signal transduction histidine kinase